MTANLAEAGESGQDMDFAFGQAFVAHGLEDLLPAAAQFGQVKLSLFLAQFAIPAFFDAVGEILSDLALEAAEHERAEFGGKAPTGDFLGPGGILALGLVVLVKIGLGSQVSGLDEIDDAPEIEQSVFQGCSSEGEAVVSTELFDRLGDLGGRVFDELRFVEDDGTELEFLKGGQVAAEQGIIGDDEIVLGNLLAEVMAGGAAFEDEDFQMGSKPVGFAPPVMEDGGWTNDEGRLGLGWAFFLEPGDPGESLEGFTKAHVIGQDSAQVQTSKMTEEIEAVLLVRAHFGLDESWDFSERNSVEPGDFFPEQIDLIRLGELFD